MGLNTENGMKSGVAVFGQGLHCNVVTASFTYLYDALDASFNSLFFFFFSRPSYRMRFWLVVCHMLLTHANP